MKLSAFVRDICVVALVALLGLQLYSERSARANGLRAQEARLATATSAISKLDALYKQAVFDSDNKGIYHQIFRQNEILIEYNKLLLTTAYLPAPTNEPGPTDLPRTVDASAQKSKSE
jgi:hypothetical protein